MRHACLISMSVMGWSSLVAVEVSKFFYPMYWPYIAQRRINNHFFYYQSEMYWGIPLIAENVEDWWVDSGTAEEGLK
jgi:hypothetical protein